MRSAVRRTASSKHPYRVYRLYCLSLMTRKRSSSTPPRWAMKSVIRRKRFFFVCRKSRNVFRLSSPVFLYIAFTKRKEGGEALAL